MAEYSPPRSSASAPERPRGYCRARAASLAAILHAGRSPSEILKRLDANEALLLRHAATLPDQDRDGMAAAIREHFAGLRRPVRPARPKVRPPRQARRAATAPQGRPVEHDPLSQRTTPESRKRFVPFTAAILVARLRSRPTHDRSVTRARAARRAPRRASSRATSPPSSSDPAPAPPAPPPRSGACDLGSGTAGWRSP